MRFLNQWAFWFLIPWVLMPFIYKYLNFFMYKRFDSFVGKALREKLTHGLNLGRRRIKFSLFFLGIFFLIIAMSRPQMGTREEEIKSEGLDIVFALDVSNSMAVEDVVPSRLKKAKHIIRTFLDRMSGDRVGVVAFAGSSIPVAPLTVDYDYVRQVLEGLDEKSIFNQGTNLFAALNTAIKFIDDGAATEAASVEKEDKVLSRTIIFLSDGEDNEKEEKSLVSTLKQKGVRVYSIGVGSLKGGPVPNRDEKGYLQGYKKDKLGNMVHSKLESKALESIAEATGGKYFPASTGESEVDEIIADMQGLDRTEGKLRRVVIYEEYFQLPLLLAIFLILLSIYISERKMVVKRKESVATLIIGAFLLMPMAHATSLEEYQESKKGMKAYEKEELPEAIDRFGRAQAVDPNSQKNNFNLGTTLLKSGAHDAAIASLEKTTKGENGNLAAKGAFHLGQALEKQGNHEQALQAYQKGLKRLFDLKKQKKFDDESADVEKNIKMALETQEQRKQQQQKQQQSEGDGKGQGQSNQDQKQNQGSSNKNDKQNDQKGKGKDDKDREGNKNENKRYEIPKEKQKFKAENISEQDAKRLMQQLKEQENQTAQRMRRQKSEQIRREAKESPSEKDW